MKPLLPMILPSEVSEVELHYKRPLFKTMRHIRSSNDAYQCIKLYIHPKRIDFKEFFWVLLLTHANRLIGIAEIGSGTSMGVKVNTKEIFQLVLITNASALIVCHNHPSGTLKVSVSDRQMTKRIQEVSKLFEVIFLDHLIITSEDFLSFSDKELL